MTEPGGIYKAMCDAMADITSIAKDRINVQQNFKFRGIDDVYNELHAILAKYRIFTLPEVLEDRTEERQTKSGGNLIYRVLKIKHHFCHEDGSSVSSTVIGEGMDSGDKASNKAMAIGHKYSLFQAFLIPTEDDKDPDAQSHEVKPKDKPAETQPGAAKEPPPTASLKPVLDQKQMQLAVRNMLIDMYVNEDDAYNELYRMTTWVKKVQGEPDKEMPGKRNPFDLGVKENTKGQTQTSVTYHQVKRVHEKWQEAQEKEVQDEANEPA